MGKKVRVWYRNSSGTRRKKSCHDPSRLRARRQRYRGELREAIGGTAPEKQEKYADEDEGEAEADPEAEGAEVAAETKPRAEGETDEPVSGEVAEHGRAGVAGATESAGGDGLDAVE